MILSYLRNSDLDRYIKIIDRLLFKKDIRFHIQLLVVQIIANENAPNKKEIAFVKQKIIGNRKYECLFIESILSEGWLKFLIEEKILQTFLIVDKIWLDSLFKYKSPLRIFLQNQLNYATFKERETESQKIIYSLFGRHYSFCQDIILKFLKKERFPYREIFIVDALYDIKNWNSKDAFDLFDKVFKTVEIQNFRYHRILTDLSVWDIDRVLKVYGENLINRIQNLKNNGFSIELKFEHEDQELFKTLRKNNFEKTFEFTDQIVKCLINKAKYTFSYKDEKIFDDAAFHGIYHHDRHGYEFLFTFMCELMEQAVKEDLTFFKKYLDDNLHSYSKTIQRIILHGINLNKECLSNQLLKLLVWYNEEQLFPDFDTSRGSIL